MQQKKWGVVVVVRCARVALETTLAPDCTVCQIGNDACARLLHLPDWPPKYRQIVAFANVLLFVQKAIES